MLGTCCGDTKASSPNDGVRVSAYKNAGATNTVSTIRWSAMHNVVGCSQDVACEVKGGQGYMTAQTLACAKVQSMLVVKYRDRGCVRV